MISFFPLYMLRSVVPDDAAARMARASRHQNVAPVRPACEPALSRHKPGLSPRCVRLLAADLVHVCGPRSPRDENVWKP